MFADVSFGKTMILSFWRYGARRVKKPACLKAIDQISARSVVSGKPPREIPYKMGKRGPLPKRSLEQELLAGNPGHKKKSNDGQICAESDGFKSVAPTPTQFHDPNVQDLREPPTDLRLTVWAQKVWRQLAPSLISTGMLTSAETFLFIEYCQLVGQALQYQDDLTKMGEFKKTTKMEFERKEVKMRNQAWDRSREIAPLIGIGFKSRQTAERTQQQIDNTRARASGSTQAPAGKSQSAEKEPEDSGEFDEFDQMVNG